MKEKIVVMITAGSEEEGAKIAKALLEARLIAILEGDATDLAKQYACRQLAMVGSDASVPVLAGLLPSPRLSHMARYALEAIPDPSVDDALREALDKVQGRQRLGVIGSLGARRD